ncbi:MAG: hypothetical protein C4542_09570 [Dehalococcoidia bacterium]|nr:MAG: hypothetical protein C4542_09570 [Dehalococcoidia bacterium]
MYARPYRAGPIEPVVEVGHNVLLIFQMKFYLYQVAFIEPVPPSHPLIANIGAINAGITSAIFNTQNVLDMPDGSFGQFRARVLDDIVVTYLQPQASTRNSTRNNNARLTAFNRLYDPNDALSEFYVFEDERMFLQAVNPTDYNLAQARVVFYGFKYILSGQDGVNMSGGSIKPLQQFDSIEAAKRSNINFTAVPVGGWGR